MWGFWGAREREEWKTDFQPGALSVSLGDLGPVKTHLVP